jgi:hypothetical protein
MTPIDSSTNLMSPDEAMLHLTPEQRLSLEQEMGVLISDEVTTVDCTENIEAAIKDLLSPYVFNILLSGYQKSRLERLCRDANITAGEWTAQLIARELASNVGKAVINRPQLNHVPTETQERTVKGVSEERQIRSVVDGIER